MSSCNVVLTFKVSTWFAQKLKRIFRKRNSKKAQTYQKVIYFCECIRRLQVLECKLNVPSSHVKLVLEENCPFLFTHFSYLFILISFTALKIRLHCRHETTECQVSPYYSFVSFALVTNFKLYINVYISFTLEFTLYESFLVFHLFYLHCIYIFSCIT